MVSSAIWDVAYFYFGEKLDWHLFCICYIRNLELLNKSLTGSDVDSNAIDCFSPFRPFFSNLATGVLSCLAPLPSITSCPYRCLARHRSRKRENTPTISQGTLQSCLTLCDPMDHSPPDSSVHGILQVRILEWAVIPFYKGSSQPQDRPASQCLLHWQAGSLELAPKGHSVQFRSVTQSCPTLCEPMNRSTPGLPVHHQLPEFTETHVHRVGDAIQPSHPLSSPSLPAPNRSQHQTLFQWVNSSHEVAKVLEFHYWNPNQRQCHRTLFSVSYISESEIIITGEEG